MQFLQNLGFGFIGLILESSNGAVLSDRKWKCASYFQSSSVWTLYGFDDSHWTLASCYGDSGDKYAEPLLGFGYTFRNPNACWIGETRTPLNANEHLYCRKVLTQSF